MRLNRSMEELEKVNGNARQAVVMAVDAAKKGDAAKAAEYNAAAEAFANRLIALEREVDDLKALSLQSAQAADQAKAAVQQNATALQQKLAERQKLLSQLDQAKMQEQMNKAMASLSETVGEDVPTFDEVRDKIEARYAKAKGMSRAHRDVGREPHARDRAGGRELRGPDPPRRDAGAARAGHSSRACSRRGARTRPGSRQRRGDALPAFERQSDDTSGWRSIGRVSSRQDDEVVAVDDLVGPSLGQL